MKSLKEHLTDGIDEIEAIIFKFVIFIIFLKKCYDFLLYSYH